MNQRTTSSQHGQRGEGRLKALIYFVVLIVAVFVAYRIVPVYVQDYQLKDYVAEQAKFAVVNRYTEEQIRDNVFRKIQDLDIPARRDDVKVQNTNNGLMITVNYTVPVDFLVYKTDINFSPSSEGRDLMK
ncbi:MAG TPA: DUF4845 domain-containing protein [Candidatus Limnocylindrales bacterium]|nr:DUF4845 domain-containing protein [Candidatus Limnocylindrales bacterium]